MRFVHLALAATIALGLASPALSAPKPEESWGRAGVDFETYRADSVECAELAYYADVSDTEQAKALVIGTRRLEAADRTSSDFIAQANAYAQINNSVRAPERIEELREAMQSIVDRCLTERGYVKFRLTEDQREHLGMLRSGSDERHHYLHSIASNSAALESQAVHEGKS
ncbi:hypothetical protein [Altererythrobacter sp. Root672]|uniref:hypothetical protein n=1 Tax=Altererythrobacter sp. Root672 TaxID=1736584 RepID=UPI0006F832B8|nr:hypothetical protein [Altererythrobacter sp. Root672]KRA82773.1 hypothetical protein ASD76_01395 [Altererythrobacter sp. Root672]